MFLTVCDFKRGERVRVHDEKDSRYGAVGHVAALSPPDIVLVYFDSTAMFYEYSAEVLHSAKSSEEE